MNFISYEFQPQTPNSPRTSTRITTSSGSVWLRRGSLLLPRPALKNVGGGRMEMMIQLAVTQSLIFGVVRI